jgi:hypothetical protein
MTTRYSVKKCDSVIFAQSIEIALEQLPSKGTYKCITRDPQPNFEKTTIQEFEPCDDVCLLVELAYKTTKQQIELSHVDGDFDEVMKLTPEEMIDELHINLSDLQECMFIFKNLCEDYNYLKDQEMKLKFLNFLSFIYPILRSSQLKAQILQILKFNNISVDELNKNFPLETTLVEVPCVLPTNDFKDIVISVEDNAEGLSSNMYKTSREDIKKATFGHSASLEAFTKGTFTVLRNRKTANIENSTLKQNHEILNLIASNGVICTPESKEILSLDLLMKKLSRCNNFSIILVHPSLEQKFVGFDKPTEFSKPEYSLNGGELIAIVYRYLLINFFGMHSIVDEDKLEYQYLF